MPNASIKTTLWVRATVLVVVLLTLLLATGRLGPTIPDMGEGPPPARVTDPVFAVYVVSVALGSFLLLRRQAPQQLLLLGLACDLLAIGGLGAALRWQAPWRPFSGDAIPYLIGFLVAVLVAAAARRKVAGVLGALAGAMVLVSGSGFVAGAAHVGTPMGLLAVQTILLTCASVEAGFVMAWVGGEIDRQRMAARIERELNQREAASGELVAFAQALATSGTLPEIAEAVLRYMRTHVAVRARAVAIESRGEVLARWEEGARIEPEDAERRRVRLQEALARAGSNQTLARIEARSLGPAKADGRMVFGSCAEVPIQVGGRVMGVVLAADSLRNAIPDSRIGVLADMGRRTAEAVQRIERRAEEEQRRTNLLLTQMREGVLLLGPDGQVLVANPAARTVLEPGEDPGSPGTIGKVPILELASTPPGVTRRFRAEGKPAGSPRPVLLSCTAFGIADGGRRLGTLVTLSDVTEEELARGRLLQSERMTLVGQTLAGVAHELNNPLAALVGYADILEARKLPDDLERPVRQMREQAIRAARIVRNLLSFAKRRNPERVPTQIGELVQSVVDLFSYEIRLNDIAIGVALPEDLPAVLGDKHALQQILVNLVQNAIHALQDMPGDRRIDIRARCVPEAIFVTVQDSGPGVPRDFRSRVFEPFFTTKGSARGTGLGLALSRAIARDHGGELALEADDGRGAAFTLRLPLPRVATAEGAGEGSPGEVETPADLPGRTFRVLVVDDEAPVREALVAQLGKMGCRVDSAASAAEAHRQILREEYDAVLLDVRMPGGTGIELHHQLKAERPSVADRIVFMSGDFTNEETVQALREAGNPFLEKPFTLAEMAHAFQGLPGAPTATSSSARSLLLGDRP